MNATPEKISRCRNIAWAGIVIMGIGSFMACLPESRSLMITGSAVLLLGIAVSAYGFTWWRP